MHQRYESARNAEGRRGSRGELTVAGNINKNDVTRVPASLAALNPVPTLVTRSRILTLEDGAPGER
jgi:iron complex outermembrane receptor protein